MKALKKILVKLRLLDRQKMVRHGVEVIPVQPNLELVVFWKDLEIGKGPALILKVHGKEILKFDCFGKDDGHFHAAPEFHKRIFFEEETASGQIERSVRELKQRVPFYLEKQGEEHIRKVKIDHEKLFTAADQAKKKMFRFLEDVPKLNDLR